MYFLAYSSSGPFSAFRAIAMGDVKSSIRKAVLDARAGLTAQEVREKSRVIINELIGLEQFYHSKVIMSYIDFRNEVMTEAFIKKCLALGKRVAVPFIYKDNSGKSIMQASFIEDMQADLERGTFGILEPRKEKIKVVEPKSIDIIAVPGVAFDTDRNRIGYGAGYYDRYLKNTRNGCLKIGIAFEIQIVENVPADAHDFPLDMIITEKRII